MKFIKTTSILILLATLFSFTITNPFDDIFNFFDKYQKSLRPDKVFVHTDKLSYSTEDTIWYKLYLVDGIDHLIDSKSKVVTIELINEKKQIIQTRKQYVDKIGTSGDFILDRSYKSGRYTLRAYTNFMKNQNRDYFFTQEFNVIDNKKLEEISYNAPLKQGQLKDPELKLNIRLFPEGGDLIEGLLNNVAIKVTDQSGRGVITSGIIEDSNGNIICPFKTYEYGLGSIKIQPESGQEYSAKIITKDSEFKTNFPDAKQNGFALLVENKPQATLININATSSLKDCRIVAHIRGSVFLNNTIESKLNTYSIKIDKSELPSGVAHINVFTANGEPMAERLFFINNIEAQCFIETDKDNYTTREAIDIKVDNLPDKLIDQEYADLSMTIYSLDNKNISPQVDNIHTWLLLNSDLRGNIENPHYFFEKPGDYKRSYLLDLMLLTHGWRRFVWKDLNKLDSLNGREQGIYINGYTASNFNKKKRVKSKLLLNFLNNNFLEEELMTNEDGTFSFGPFVSFDTIQAFIQARRPKKDKKQDKLEGKRNIHIELVNDFSTPKLDHINGGDIKLQVDSFASINSFIDHTQKSSILKDQMNLMRVQLDELVITTKRKTKEDEMDQVQKNNSIYSEPSFRLILSETDHMGVISVFDLLRRTPGVAVRGSPPEQSATIRGPISINASSTPLYLVDGIRVDEQFINWINPQEVLFIDVIRGPQAAIFGVNGAAGAIAIYTGNQNTQVKARKPGIIDFQFSGFYKSREFYSEDHSIKSNVYSPDYRTTLHWEPSILLDNQTEYTKKIYSSDIKGPYLIQLQGLKSNGQTIYEEKLINVN